MIDLRSLNFTELAEVLKPLPKFRTEQVYKWIHQKSAQSFAEMTNLSADLQSEIAEKVNLTPLVPKKRLTSADGTEKFLWRLHDGNHVESVFMKYEHGNSACLSTQAGCRMGCRFCASTQTGFARNLTAGEMLGQLYDGERELGLHADNIVLMGIGEPLDNFENTVKFLTLLSDEKGRRQSLRRVSLSTCGIVPKMYELAKLNLPLTLSVSLHQTTDAARSELMPINQTYPLPQLLTACGDYFKTTGRRVSFEYALIDGIGDDRRSAEKLANLLLR